MSIATIVAWMQSVVGSGVKVIQANQNAPRPAAPYITVQSLSNMGQMFPSVERTVDPEGVKFAVQNHRERTYSINAYGDDAEALLEQIHDAAGLPSSVARPILRDMGSPRDLSFLDDALIEPRFQCEMTFAENSTFDVTDPAVDSVQATGEILDPTGEKVLDSSVSVEV